MEQHTAPGERPTTVAVVTRLAARITNGDAPLGAIADTLTDLATALDAQRVIVAVDDGRLGRQVFTSARSPLGTVPVGLFGTPGTWTEPADCLDVEQAQLVTATVGVAVASLRQDDDAPLVAVAYDGPEQVLGGAVARARDYGWAFTFALVRFDDDVRSAARLDDLRAALRPGDVVLSSGRGTIGVVLPATRDDEVAPILSAAVRAAVLPRCAFGIARCPNDGVDVDRLLALAAQRLDAALAARDPAIGSD